MAATTAFSGPSIMTMRRSIRMQEYSELYSSFPLPVIAHTYFQSFWLSMITIIKSISSRPTHHHMNIGSLRCLRETRLIMRQVILWTPFIAAVSMCFGSSCIREMFVECKPSFSYHKLIGLLASHNAQRTGGMWTCSWIQSEIVLVFTNIFIIPLVLQKGQASLLPPAFLW